MVFFSFPECGEIWERQVETEETRESEAERRGFWKSPGVFRSGDSLFRDVEQCSLFTEKNRQMGGSLGCTGGPEYWERRLSKEGDS